MAAVEETSVPVVAVTAAVGAIVLLFVLICSVAKKAEDKKDESGIISWPLRCIFEIIPVEHPDLWNAGADVGEILQDSCQMLWNNSAESIICCLLWTLMLFIPIHCGFSLFPVTKLHTWDKKLQVHYSYLNAKCLPGGYCLITGPCSPELKKKNIIFPTP